MRLWSYTTLERFKGTVAGRARFVFSPMAIVDLLAIAPFYLPVLGMDLRSVRMLRLLRAFRLIKLGRYSKTLKLFGRVAAVKKVELVTVLVFVAITLVMASTVLYYAETAAQPEVFSSIPATMWRAIETLSTVGYGAHNGLGAFDGGSRRNFGRWYLRASCRDSGISVHGRGASRAGEF